MSMIQTVKGTKKFTNKEQLGFLLLIFSKSQATVPAEQNSISLHSAIPIGCWLYK